ncbi:MAG TPA: DUF2889 domain-containing protein [Candidatus Tectomicrobia bacterium]|nr:DUF2889 domain-containing protein [Candidatus Tectomicrobia bacterium]
MSEVRTPVHTRTILMEAARVGDDELEVTGHLVDERPEPERWFGIESGPRIHDMSVTIRVRHPGLVVTHVDARMDSHPYTICTDAIDPLQSLVGLPVGRGFTRAVNERLGRARGCAHLTALVHAIAPVIRQGAGVAFPRSRRTAPEAPADLWFVGTCQAWRENGPLHARLLAGDVAGLRALSARVRR